MEENQTYLCSTWGSLRISEYSWPEEHEKQISDKYLSWGWNEDQKNQELKFFVILKKEF